MLSAVVALCAIAATSAVLVRTVPRERLRVTVALVLALSTGAAMLIAAEQHQIAVKISVEILSSVEAAAARLAERADTPAPHAGCHGGSEATRSCGLARRPAARLP